MTKEKLAKAIKDILKGKEYDRKTADREELLRVLNDIEEYTQTEGDADLYFDIIWCDNPIAIQVFTKIEIKGRPLDIIIDFDMPTPSNENDLIDAIWEEYQKAVENINFFKS